MKLRIHNFIEKTSVNGPGIRFGLWVQGCNLKCPNCFNPQTHSFDSGKLYEVEDIFNKILAVNGIEGISISGGEPFLQPKPLLELVRLIKEKTNLTVLIFSGFYLSELVKRSLANKILTFVDVLIAGRYIKEKQINDYLRSSDNQQIHFLSDRYALENFDANSTEIIITEDGTIIYSGQDLC